MSSPGSPDGLPENISLRHPGGLLATWFGAGLLPFAPGTWGSVAALPLAWLIHAWAGSAGLFTATIVVFLVGWWAANWYLARSSESDPAPVVIDEVAGQWLVLVLVPPSVGYYLLGFVLFRFFDIRKPWPVGWADKQVKGGLGIMADDILAGIYAGAIVYIVILLTGGENVLG